MEFLIIFFFLFTRCSTGAFHSWALFFFLLSIAPRIYVFQFLCSIIENLSIIFFFCCCVRCYVDGDFFFHSISFYTYFSCNTIQTNSMHVHVQRYTMHTKEAKHSMRGIRITQLAQWWSCQYFWWTRSSSGHQSANNLLIFFLHFQYYYYFWIKWILRVVAVERATDSFNAKKT